MKIMVFRTVFFQTASVSLAHERAGRARST
jgi:hypothetical protein